MRALCVEELQLGWISSGQKLELPGRDINQGHVIHDHMTFKMAVVPCKEVIVVLVTLIYSYTHVCSAI